jgi:hypothetical protein
MSTRKTTTKKPAAKSKAKKPAAKKATTKKAQAKKPAPRSQEFVSQSMLADPDYADSMERRPVSGPDIPTLTIGIINHDLNAIKTTLDNYAAHLRALDRRRLNGVGIKKQGFIDRTLAVAEENREFLPHYLTIERFRRDNNYFGYLRDLVDIAAQIRELLWNITIEAADGSYTNALEYYASVREAAKRRVDAAESIFRELEPFFKSNGRRREDSGAAPTKKQQLRNAKALIDGRRDGKIVIENIKPKITGGEHKVIDEQFRDAGQFKESEEGEIKE